MAEDVAVKHFGRFLRWLSSGQGVVDPPSSKDQLIRAAQELLVASNRYFGAMDPVALELREAIFKTIKAADA